MLGWLFSNCDAIAVRLEVLDTKGSGDFVRVSDASMEVVDAPVLRLASHERSSAPALAFGVNSFDGDVGGDVTSEGVDCLSGDPPEGVTALTVAGDWPEGDSGLLKGDIRLLLPLLPNESGAGRSGLGGFDCDLVSMAHTDV